MRWLMTFVVVGLLGLSLCPVADARPGGGHSFSSGGGSHSYSSGSRSYSGGSRSYSSGGGGGGSSSDAAIGLVFMFGLIIAVFVIAAVNAQRNEAALNLARASEPEPVHIQALLAPDPQFSQVAFEDFAFRLIAEVHRASGTPGELAKIAPYVAPEIVGRFATLPTVSQVVIGSLRTVHVNAGANFHTVEVRTESNVARTGLSTLYIVERWKFTRSSEAKTRKVDRARIFACPNCGAPFLAGGTPRTCSHCNTEIGVGRFDWTLTEHAVNASTTVGMTLTGTVEEVGNDLVTIVAPDSGPVFESLQKEDTSVTWNAIRDRLHLIYNQLNAAWNAQDLTPVRGLVSQSLLGYLQYWITEYKRQRLVNRLEKAEIERIVLAKVTRDQQFDAITVRVYAKGIDYTVDSEGRLVGGSKERDRAYTEYWTLIRSSARRGPIRADTNCPNCGAPLAVSDAGACTHCNAEVESGSFDFVLSKIEQDEVYAG